MESRGFLAAVVGQLLEWIEVIKMNRSPMFSVIIGEQKQHDDSGGEAEGYPKFVQAYDYLIGCIHRLKPSDADEGHGDEQSYDY